MAGRQRILEEELKRYFYDWDGEFDVDVEAEDWYGDYEHFSVVITYKRGNLSHTFQMRVDSDDTSQINIFEDTYHELSAAELWNQMWFDLALHPERCRHATEKEPGQ